MTRDNTSWAGRLMTSLRRTRDCDDVIGVIEATCQRIAVKMLRFDHRNTHTVDDVRAYDAASRVRAARDVQLPKSAPVRSRFRVQTAEKRSRPSTATQRQNRISEGRFDFQTRPKTAGCSSSTVALVCETGSKIGH